MVSQLKRYRVSQHNTPLPMGKVVYKSLKQDLEGFIAVHTAPCGRSGRYFMHQTDLIEWPYDEFDED